jgi:hypothetical protein
VYVTIPAPAAGPKPPAGAWSATKGAGPRAETGPKKHQRQTQPKGASQPPGVRRSAPENDHATGGVGRRSRDLSRLSGAALRPAVCQRLRGGRRCGPYAAGSPFVPLVATRNAIVRVGRVERFIVAPVSTGRYQDGRLTIRRPHADSARRVALRAVWTGHGSPPFRRACCPTSGERATRVPAGQLAGCAAVQSM